MTKVDAKHVETHLGFPASWLPTPHRWTPFSTISWQDMASVENSAMAGAWRAQRISASRDFRSHSESLRTLGVTAKSGVENCATAIYSAAFREPICCAESCTTPLISVAQHPLHCRFNQKRKLANSSDWPSSLWTSFCLGARWNPCFFHVFSASAPWAASGSFPVSFLLVDSPGDDDDSSHLNTVFREQDASINSVAWTVRNGLVDLKSRRRKHALSILWMASRGCLKPRPQLWLVWPWLVRVWSSAIKSMTRTSEASGFGILLRQNTEASSQPGSMP